MGVLTFLGIRTVDEITFAVCYIDIKLEKTIYLCGMKLYLPNRQIKSRAYYLRNFILLKYNNGADELEIFFHYQHVGHQY